MPNMGRVSDCNAYRGMSEGQTVEEYVAELAEELDAKFREMGPETVCAFVAEPVVGAVCQNSFWRFIAHYSNFNRPWAVSLRCRDTSRP